jgi:putative ABC transport system permease protein
MEKLLRMAWRNLTHHRTRTLVTMIGIVIGIASVVALISLGDGLTASISEQLENLGPDKVTVMASMGGGFGPPSGGAVQLSDRDVELINDVDGVKLALPMLFKSLPVKFQDRTTFVSFTAFPTDKTKEFFSDMQNYEVDEGRTFAKGEQNVAVMGARLSEQLFDSRLEVRDKIKILDKDVLLIGTMKATGDSDTDNGIIIPIETLREITGNEDEITFVFVKVDGNPSEVANRIEDELEDFHKEKLFNAYSTDQLMNQINAIFGVLSFVLIGIAGISLVVAGFGILNTMLMSVIERTREIGILKAIGATNHTILAMFLTESAIVGMLGGAVGCLVGYMLSFTMGGFAESFLGLALRISVNPLLVASVIAFAAGVGVLSGTYPAYRAAQLDPVEALRYE